MDDEESFHFKMNAQLFVFAPSPIKDNINATSCTRQIKKQNYADGDE